MQRTVRFAVNEAASDAAGSVNGYAGRPSMVGLSRHYQVRIECAGRPDPATGYLIDIKRIDRAVREAGLPILARACAERASAEPMDLLRSLCGAIGAALPIELRSVRLDLSPYYSVAMTTRTPEVALLRQRFDFAAAHRLHVPSLSDEENRAIFGKCNLPNGHGHNYQIEPCVAVRLDGAEEGRRFTLSRLERMTDEVIIERFDHTNLNVDTAEFGPEGLNPTVENIARVCYELLSEAIRAETDDAELRHVTVWETDRTCCTYPAGRLGEAESVGG